MSFSPNLMTQNQFWRPLGVKIIKMQLSKRFKSILRAVVGFFAETRGDDKIFVDMTAPELVAALRYIAVCFMARLKVVGPQNESIVELDMVWRCDGIFYEGVIFQFIPGTC